MLADAVRRLPFHVKLQARVELVLHIYALVLFTHDLNVLARAAYLALFKAVAAPLAHPLLTIFLREVFAQVLLF